MRRPSSPEPLRGEGGFTLVEVLVVALLLGVVLSAAAAVLPTAVRTQAEDARRIDALDRAGEALARLQRDVRQATALTQPAADVLDLRLPERRPGQAAVERRVRWDCSPGDRCERSRLADDVVTETLRGLDGDLVLQPGARGVALRVAIEPGPPLGPVVLTSQATRRVP